MSTPSEIVARFGGPEIVASRFGLSRKAVEVWALPDRGIPGKWHIPMLLWASELGVPLSMDELATPREPLEASA
jgi:hypothetical protein